MNRASKSAHSGTSPCTKPGVSEVLETLSKLATHANDLLDWAPRLKGRIPNSATTELGEG
jgi:hypothetical protein